NGHETDKSNASHGPAGKLRGTDLTCLVVEKSMTFVWHCAERHSMFVETKFANYRTRRKFMQAAKCLTHILSGCLAAGLAVFLFAGCQSDKGQPSGKTA